jgi:hypothetical protein
MLPALNSESAAGGGTAARPRLTLKAANLVSYSSLAVSLAFALSLLETGTLASCLEAEGQCQKPTIQGVSRRFQKRRSRPNLQEPGQRIYPDRGDHLSPCEIFDAKARAWSLRRSVSCEILCRWSGVSLCVQYTFLSRILIGK